MIAVTLIFPASATELGDLTPMDLNPIDTEEINVLNELTVRSTVTKYFNERLAFLKGETPDFPTAIPAVRDDESKHRELIVEKGITLMSSVITFESVHCENLYARIAAIETLMYVDINGNHTELIEHKLSVAFNDDKVLVAAGDAYMTEFSEFLSCSYVPPELESHVPNAVGGSRFCMQDIASQEVGVTETGTNYTDYGKWYQEMGFGYDGWEWCSIFVMWCANQCNVSASIIPRGYTSSGQNYAAASVMRQYYADRDLYFESTDETTAPRIGDLFFEGTSSTSVYHIGIIVAVDSTYIHVVDGNCDNQVREHSIPRDGSSFVGFARPAYVTTGHTINTANGWYYDSSEHWYICESCTFPVDKSNHTLGSWQTDTIEHWRKCSGCNVTFNLGSHSYGGWNYSSTYHWKACTSCAYKINNAAHTMSGWVYNNNQHWKTCSTCGYKANTGAHTYTAGVCSTCRYNPNISIDKIPGMERSPQ